MSDMISREAVIETVKRAIWDEYTAKDAIDAVCNIHARFLWDMFHETCNLAGMIDAIEGLPSAQTERKRGKWVKLDIHPHLADHKCTACGESVYVPTCMGEPMYLFCPNCGALMREDGEEG